MNLDPQLTELQRAQLVRRLPEFEASRLTPELYETRGMIAALPSSEAA